MKSAMNMERVRRQNRSLILSFINDHGPSSRKDISLATGLTQASVTQITTALISEGILKEGGSADEGKKSAGRRKILLHIDASSSFVLSVNAEPDKTTIAVCDLMGTVLCDTDSNSLIRQFPTRSELAPSKFLDIICKHCSELLGFLPRAINKRIEYLSFTTTGIVDTEKGLSCHAYGIWEEEVPVGKLLQERLHLPVLVENNVDAFALAELLFGTGKRHPDLLVIKWGPGVGSSVIINGRVYHGRHGKTAEMGHFIVDPDGETCICGRKGCLETRVSERALQALCSDNERTKAIDLFARSIVNAGTILAPGRIVLFGSLADNDALRSDLIRGCKNYDASYSEKRIIHTSLAGKESYIGPVAVYTNHKFLHK